MTNDSDSDNGNGNGNGKGKGLPEGVQAFRLTPDNIPEVHETLAEIFGEANQATPPSEADKPEDFTYTMDQVPAAIWSGRGLSHNLTTGKFNDEAILSRLKNTPPYRWGLNDFLYSLAKMQMFQSGEQEYLQAMLVEIMQLIPFRTESGHWDKNLMHMASMELTEAQLEDLREFFTMALRWQRT